MDWSPLISAFILISLTELGDKTMVAVITLSSTYPKRTVFFGSFLALAAVTAVGVLIGEVLFQFVPSWIVGLAAGVVFILFGILALLRPENDEEESIKEIGCWGGFMTAFGFVALMEMGDKSQISVITLSAESGDAIMVFIGVVLAFLWITALTATLGKAIGDMVPRNYVRIGSGLVFIVFGIIFMAQQLF